jgi:hypothetical protein
MKANPLKEKPLTGNSAGSGVGIPGMGEYPVAPASVSPLFFILI